MKYITLIQNGRIITSESHEANHHYANDYELAKLISDLIDEGFLFTDEPAGWPPAAIAKSLQEKGLLEKSFTAITWQSQQEYRTYQVNP